MKTFNMYFSLNVSLKYVIILIFLFLLYFLLPAFQLYTILCISEIFVLCFSPYCNQHNQPFTLTHNNHHFCCSANYNSAILFAACLYTFIFPLFTRHKIVYSREFQSLWSKVWLNYFTSEIISGRFCGVKPNSFFVYVLVFDSINP